ncbi:MAG: HD domain-containing protein [Rhabdochlamydiaceae bacterium]|nr:HD domain-containing protein [Candidatus Amphrikana amoebophyrae]
MPNSKKIFDALHGFIHLNAIESQVAEHQSFRRLIDVRQLGVSYLVYPGATHSRYEHSLGVMHIATEIFDNFIEKLDDKGILKNLAMHSNIYRQVLRLAALCHDLGHLPFSHTAEARVFKEKSHEWMTAQILEKDLFNLDTSEIGVEAKELVAKIAIGPKKCDELELGLSPFNPIEKLLSQMITDDFFGADRIDYLLRDGKCCGLSYGQFDYLQLIEMITAIENENGEMELAVEEAGLAACESMLLARYFMYSRVYYHPLVKTLSYHLSIIIEKLCQRKKVLNSVDSYLALSDADVLVEVKAIAKNKQNALYPHAIAILDPLKAYKMMRLTDDHLKKVSKYDAFCDIEVNPLGKNRSAFNFFVKKKNNQIMKADQLTELKIPHYDYHFGYATDENFKKIEKFIC